MIRTITRPVRHEPPKIKGSRFIASVEQVESPEAAADFVEARREEFRDATHNCFAWRAAADRDTMRYGDDGEPSGTAGRPILQEIDGRGLSGVVVVVTRYYGGTKLGTGGLIRAYGGTASAALDLAGVVETPVVEVLRLAFPYGFSGAVQGVLAAFELIPSRADYGAEVRQEVAVAVEEAARLERSLKDATRGRIEIERA
ncbi:MAG: YigZ family protein [bacterium]|nr:YigZ family protein [bacterium]